MARIRSVHPSLFTDEAWVSCGPLTRILYIGLWTDADDQGLFEWKPLQIKMRLLPGDTGNVGDMLAELEAVDLIKAYEVNGKRFGAIANFRKFQRPQKPSAIHPLPDFIAEYVSLSATSSEPVEDQSRTDTGISPQMEDGGWKGEEKDNREAIASLVIALANAIERGCQVMAEREAAKAKVEEDFKVFYAAYPLRKAPDAARKAFAKAMSRITEDDPLAVILAGIERALPGWDLETKKYIPHPASWLNAGSWNDEAPTPRMRLLNDRSSAKLEHLDGIARAMAAACEPNQHDGRNRWEPGDGGRMRALPSAA